jgi:two-component system, chemotaxis family, CheB/CheR fusion protein
MSSDVHEVTLDVLLEFVKHTRGFDFTGYKRSTIERRLAKRMGELELERYEDYVDHLELHPEEFSALFNTLLINVTGFFRDPATWEHLATDVVPHLVTSRPPAAPLRVWCAGCASGEEPYTVAMVLARALGEAGLVEHVKIYATDVDEEALDVARHGAYSSRDVEDVPRDALQRFFERSDGGYTFRRDLRRAVIFGRNDLVHDAPISRVDLLVCRNTLMYFNAETQERILRRFHVALDDDGLLVLGKSEMLVTHADLFRAGDPKRRIFTKVQRPGTPLAIADALRVGAYDATVGAQIVVDRDGAVAMVNSYARYMLGVGAKDVGRLIYDLDVSYRPIELRARLERMRDVCRPVLVEGVRWRSPTGQERVLDVRMTPVVADGELLGTVIAFEDATEVFSLQAELAESQRDLAEAHDELLATVEELETTNEELLSTNEELLTTNEELRSTNEELETILSTVGVAVVVLDRRQHVRLWNGSACELWGLTAAEVEGRHLLGLDVGLPVDQLEPRLLSVLRGNGGDQEITLDAVNRRGEHVSCTVRMVALSSPGYGESSGIILMMEPAPS